MYIGHISRVFAMLVHADAEILLQRCCYASPWQRGLSLAIVFSVESASITSNVCARNRQRQALFTMEMHNKLPQNFRQIPSALAPVTRSNILKI